LACNSSVAAAVAETSRHYDLAVLCVPAAVTAPALREAAANGIKAALVCAGGFAEAGGQGIQYGTDVAEAVADTGIRLLGPNTSGFFVPSRGLRASFVPGIAEVMPGNIAIVAASGGVNHLLAFKLQRLGVGVSLGAAGDVGAPEVLRYLGDHDETKAVLLHIESVTDGRALFAAVRDVARQKPIVALVVGQNDVTEFAQSHTGALTNSWRTTRDLLRQAGAVIVDDEDALVLSGIALSRWRSAPHVNLGVGLVTGQAGPSLILADTLKGAGISLPPLTGASMARLRELLPPLTYQGNPVDTGRPGPTWSDVLSTVADDPNIGLVAVYALTEPVVDLPSAVQQAVIDDDVPVLIGIDGPEREFRTAVDSGSALGFPISAGPTALSHAVIAIVSDARGQALLASEEPALPDGGAPTIPTSESGWDELAAKDVLGALGIRTPPRARCRSRAETHDALNRVGIPAAVKIIDAQVLHKSHIGGVHLNVSTSEQLDLALDSLVSIGATEFLVEKMAPSGVDLIVGVRRDEIFGSLAVVGMGGIAAELTADVAMRAIPAGPMVLDSMVDSLATRELLFGYRGGPMLDRDELTGLLGRLSAAFIDSPEIAEIEINPLRLTRDGLVALDAVIIAVTRPPQPVVVG
jgi:acetyltransferase